VACRKKHANFDREAQDRLCSIVMQPPSPPFSDAQPCSPHSSGSALLSHGTDGQGLPVRAHTLQFLQPPCIFVLLRTYPSPNMSSSSPAILISVTLTTGGQAKKGVRSEHLRVEDDLVGALWLEKIGWHLVLSLASLSSLFPLVIPYTFTLTLVCLVGPMRDFFFPPLY
jgi:hypothetical protein